MTNLTIERGSIEEIPYMLIYGEGALNLPLVIHAHGFGMDQYEGMELAVMLSEKGFASVTFDLCQHGKRYDGFLERITSDVDFGYALFGIIQNSLVDLEKLIRYFQNDIRVDINRRGLTGTSLGANLSYYAMVHNPKIKTAVSILGSPSFTDLLLYSMEKDTVEDFISDEEKGLYYFVNEMDPYRSLLDAEPKPLLMINASEDEDIPARFAEDLFQDTKNKYSVQSLPVEYIQAEGFHFVSKEMKIAAMSWFEKHL